MNKFIALVLLSLMSFNVMAGDWKKLGERRVSFSSDRDVIHVSALRGKFDAIAFSVGKAPIYLSKIKIYFGNGQTQSLHINKRLEKGKRSVPYRLLGGDRVINKVEMNYRTAIGGHKYAEMNIFGRRD
ncbi:hypothetical protein [Endozoicomonas ascidiicola]|uniref:DUF2541 family protein n=1 Tax=Endozoicomonas ascidiicola TaxID=1698521 RepID=UPI00083344EA|nr:hypothetical protein [Endozoicomonas ascidiicola]